MIGLRGDRWSPITSNHKTEGLFTVNLIFHSRVSQPGSSHFKGNSLIITCRYLSQVIIFVGLIQIIGYMFSCPCLIIVKILENEKEYFHLLIKFNINLPHLSLNKLYIYRGCEDTLKFSWGVGVKNVGIRCYTKYYVKTAFIKRKYLRGVKGNDIDASCPFGKMHFLLFLKHPVISMLLKSTVAVPPVE